MADSVISCEHLTHFYGKRKIYEDLNFEVAPGRIVGLLGKNGTGKTTTINILMGYLKPQSGTCRIYGEDVQHIGPATRRRIALLLEGHVQYEYMSIAQIEKFYAAFYPKWNREAYYGLMEKLHVAPGQRISRMSNGQRSQLVVGDLFYYTVKTSDDKGEHFWALRSSDFSPVASYERAYPSDRSLPGLRFTSSIDNWVKPRFK